MNDRMRRGFLMVLVAVAMTAAVTAVAAAAPRAQEVPVCTVAGDKVASPAQVLLGETVQVRLTLDPDCPPAVLREAEIVLVVDRSLSMWSDGKLDAAKNAARAFVSNTDLSIHRVGIVSFANATFPASIGLSQSEPAIMAAIDAIDIQPGTNIASAIDAAYDMLGDGRPQAVRVMILMSDGSPNAPAPDPRTAAIRSANFAKIDNIEIYAIGLGRDADEALMQSLATSPSHYFFAPAAPELQSIYEQIAVVVGASALKDLTLDDDLSADVDLVPGSPSRPATVNGRRLTWQEPAIPNDGLTWTYEITPTRAGTYPTNDYAVANFTNADESRQQFVFPQPIITVVDPNETRTCNQPDAWTVMIHSFPDMVGFSRPGVPGCNVRFDSGDWFGGTFPPLPQLEYQLTDATGTKVLAKAKGVPGTGRVDQRLNLRACDPPPYRLRLLTDGLNGYELCYNSPSERIITERDFRRSVYRSAEERFGFTR